MSNKALSVVAVLLLAACGDDPVETNNTTGSNNVRIEDNNRTPNNGTTNNGTTPNNGMPNNGNPNNGTVNNGGPNNTTGSNNTTGNNGTGAITEAEPNDDRDGANMITFGDAVSGVLEAGGEDNFVLTATAGRILEVEIVSADPSLNISMFVEGATSDIGDRRFDFDNLAGNKRQFFLPENDIWYVTLQSLESVDWDYEFAVREVTPTPVSNAFSAPVAGDLNGGAVDIYELPSADGEVTAQLDAERLNAGSDMDSVMYVYSPNSGFVTFNDDASGSTDSELDFTAAAGETYWLVVDAWLLGASNPYELTVTLP